MNDFTKTINPKHGIRPTKRTPRDTQFLSTCKGAVGRDNILQVLESITRLATTAITDGFPYPQLFVFNRVIIICGETGIYEWENNALVLKLTVTAGSTWRALSAQDYVYLSNGVVAVTRNPGDYTYSVSDDAPICNSMCNYNNQILVGGFKS